MSESQPDRRDLLKATCAVCLGAAAVSVPLAAGGLMALDPLLRREGRASEEAFRPVTRLEAIPPGAPPRSFAVIADEEDSWNRTPNVEIGSVLLFREATSEDDEKPTVLAWSAICSHLGCRIDWKDDLDAFFCPCHSSAWDESGTRTNEVAPRDMDRLETEVRDGVVWVKYLEFKTGTPEQVRVT